MDPKAEIVHFYDRVADQFDQVGPRSFAVFGRKLVDFAHPEPGMRVLDVATGRGANLIPAAQAVAMRGLAVGIDLAFEMVHRTCQSLPIPPPANLALVQMDAEQLAFPPATFDLVLCGFAIFFLDPLRALPEWRRVLRPAGQVALSLVEKSDPRWDWYEEKLRDTYQRLGLPMPTSARPGVTVLNKPPEISAALQEFGFSDIRIASYPIHLTYPDVETWWESKWTHGSRRPLENMPAEALARFKAEVLVEARKTGAVETWNLACILATRP